jgi:cellulose synthase/poly-beta-1,6-N-acetylglucosamine synthase-like glycosyltransferase
MIRVVQVILLVSFLSAAAGAAPAPSSGSLRGTIYDPRGYVIYGVTVVARNQATGEETNAIADQVVELKLQLPGIAEVIIQKAQFVFVDNLPPGNYVLYSQCDNIEPMRGNAVIEAGKTTEIELFAMATRPTGNLAVDNHIGSSANEGGSYPAGNISYLNMNDSLDYYLMFTYFSILILLSCYGVYRYRMVYLFLRYKKYPPKPKAQFAHDRLPRVTVQLPLYNEMYVAERLIEAMVKLEYPRELLEVQVLDDSTDGTTEIARHAVQKYFEQGFDIVYHHRVNRTGFKAGALEEGLKKSSGELILIFDADFVPRPDSLRKMVHHFTDERVGMVQMRWSHINSEYSLLTKVQAMMLDAHFVIEQTARNRCGGFFNFNGTAGMWRREAIEWSGGWQHDTLAEDTDLSYRAQLMGWHFVYLMDEDVPAELPVDISAFKSQQKRWAKGVVQVGIKLMKRMWKDPRLTLQTKLEQFFRLSGNLAAPLVIVLALVNLPILIVRYNQGLFHLFVLDVPILTFSTLSVVAFFLVPQIYLHPGNWKGKLKYIPFAMSMGIALTFSNARAVLEALVGYKTDFVRTPKYRIEESKDKSWVKKSYAARGIKLPWLEMMFACYFLFTVWYAVKSRIFGTIPFLLIYLFGYAYATVMAIAPNLSRAKSK